jgi:NAD(P)-dependent dehydrogenase (short-subunit alcohol dehydrogenase family)
MRELEGKVCLVTGGSRGIGHAIVEALANAGANVAFTYHHSTEAASELVKATDGKGVKCRAYEADVANPDEMRRVVEQVIKEFGHIAILANNAGITRDKSFLKMTKDMWQEVMHVDLDGVFYTTQLVAQDMVQAGCGRIINIASIVGQTGNFGQANYAAAKGAVIDLSSNEMHQSRAMRPMLGAEDSFLNSKQSFHASSVFRYFVTNCCNSSVSPVSTTLRSSGCSPTTI